MAGNANGYWNPVATNSGWKSFVKVKWIIIIIIIQLKTDFETLKTDINVTPKPALHRWCWTSEPQLVELLKRLVSSSATQGLPLLPILIGDHHTQVQYLRR
jgi:hypothetical protein